MSFVAGTPNLVYLNLNTKITDRGIQAISKLEHLEYLNIVGTEITDKSIKTIMMLPNLKSLYTWNSQITEEGLKLIQSRMPNTKK